MLLGKNFLGINFSFGQGMIRLNKTDYFKDMLLRFGMKDCKPVSTPMEAGLRLGQNDTKGSDSAEGIDKVVYQAAIGSLMYGMLGTRPDISYAVGTVS